MPPNGVTAVLLGSGLSCCPPYQAWHEEITHRVLNATCFLSESVLSHFTPKNHLRGAGPQ